MIFAKLNEKAERYAKCAYDAFKTAEWIEVNESAGLSPESNEAWTEIIEYGKKVIVAVNYTLNSMAGCWSDSMYHVTEPNKVRRTIFKFEDGVLTRDDGPVFEKPWLTQSRNSQTEFFYEYTDIIYPPACIEHATA